MTAGVPARFVTPFRRHWAPEVFLGRLVRRLPLFYRGDILQRSTLSTFAVPAFATLSSLTQGAAQNAANQVRNNTAAATLRAMDVSGAQYQPLGQGLPAFSGQPGEHEITRLARVLDEVKSLEAQAQSLPADSTGDLIRLKGMLKSIADLNQQAFTLTESLFHRAVMLQQDMSCLPRQAGLSSRANWLADGDGVCTGADVARLAARRPSLELDTALRDAQYQAGHAKAMFREIEEIGSRVLNDTAGLWG